MLTLSIVARLPLAMFSIGLLVHAQRLTGSFAAAGLVTAAYAIALGLGGPLLGRVVDRRGQTPSCSRRRRSSLALLLVDRAAPRGRRRCRVLVALAAGIGLATPPVGACVRTLLRDPRAFAVEASAVELCWVFGPPLGARRGRAVLDRRGARGRGRACCWPGRSRSPPHPPRAPGGRQPTSRARAAARCARRRCGRSSLVMGAVGAIFGATEIGVTAAAEALGSTAAAGPLLGVWGVGSLLGGVWLARRGGVAPLVPLLVALAVGHAALVGRRAQRVRARRGAAARRAPRSRRPTRSSTRSSSARRPPARSPRRSRGWPPRSPSAPRSGPPRPARWRTPWARPPCSRSPAWRARSRWRPAAPAPRTPAPRRFMSDPFL